MPRSFAFRLGAAFAGVGIAAAALTAILVNGAFGSRFEGYLDAQQRTKERQLVAVLAESYERAGGWDEGDLRSLTPLAFMDGGTLRLLDMSQEVVWSPTSDELLGEMAEMHREMMGDAVLGPGRTLAVEVDDRRVGTAIVRLPVVGLLPQDVAFRRSVNRLLLTGGLAAGLVSLLVGVVLARRATGPARDVAAAARRFAAGDRSSRVAYDGNDEFGDMARAFNVMAEAVDEEDRLRRGFAADVAHEVRTPLTILRSELEAIQDGIVEATPTAIGSLHEETLRLTRLISDLETLASADAAGFTLRSERVDLSAMVEEGLREFDPVAAERGIELKADLDDVHVDADPDRVRQVLANLLSNALKFTSAGGRVAVRVWVDGRDAALSVSDSGTGIPAGELPRVFDRFFRGHDARAGGSGIGLTVVRDLVEAHGGTIAVTSEAARGTTFTARLPLRSSGTNEDFTAPSRPAATVGGEGGGGR